MRVAGPSSGVGLGTGPETGSGSTFGSTLLSASASADSSASASSSSAYPFAYGLGARPNGSGGKARGGPALAATGSAGYRAEPELAVSGFGGRWSGAMAQMDSLTSLDSRSPSLNGSVMSGLAGNVNGNGNGQGIEEGRLSRGGSGEGERRGNVPEWKYEMRREAQEVIPGLYLGPFQSSLNLDRMRSMGITHVLCIRDHKEARFIFPRFPTEFRYMTLDISDNTDQNLITVFPRCRDFIEEALAMGGTVLAHCNGGIALSPAIIIGYLIWKFSWSAEAATAYVQNKRYCVSTMSFSNQFKEYEPIQLAQKMVSQAGGMAGGRGKRQASDEDEDDEDDRRRKQLRDENDDIAVD
ncbi:hypothetical protein IAU60_004010 [Kwoniella sp. DSM 27419]